MKQTFPLEAGILVRGAVIGQIKNYCYQYNIDFDYSEDRRLLKSYYVIKLEGDDVSINNLIDWLTNLSNKP